MAYGGGAGGCGGGGGWDGGWEGQDPYAEDVQQRVQEKLSYNLTTEQEILKGMLPATEPHKSIKHWVTPQMLCVRFCLKTGHDKKKDTRVIAVTPTILFLVHPLGEVRRFVKMTQVESAIASDVQLGGRRYPQLLLRCAPPEHDILLTFKPDSRNIDPRDTAATVLQRLEQLKRLRGEYFPVQRMNGELFELAELQKAPQYIKPKQRLDRAMMMGGYYDNSEPEYAPDGTDPVDFLGACAGQMGESDPRPVQCELGSPVKSPAAAAVLADRGQRRVTFDGRGGQQQQPPPGGERGAWAPAGAGYPNSPPQQPPPQQQQQYPPQQQPGGYGQQPPPPQQGGYGGAHPGAYQQPPPQQPPPQGAYQQPPGGYQQPPSPAAYPPGGGGGGYQQAPPSPGPQQPPPGTYAASPSPYPPPGSPYGARSQQAPSQGRVIGSRELFGNELDQAEQIETARLAERRRIEAADARRWSQRGQIARRCNSPRPEDLGACAADRSPRPDPLNQQGHDWGYGPDDNQGYGAYN